MSVQERVLPISRLGSTQEPGDSGGGGRGGPGAGDGGGEVRRALRQAACARGSFQFFLMNQPDSSVFESIANNALFPSSPQMQGLARALAEIYLPKKQRI